MDTLLLVKLDKSLFIYIIIIDQELVNVDCCSSIECYWNIFV